MTEITIEEIRNQVKEWPKEKRLEYSGLCGELSRGRPIEEAMILAYNEVNGADDNG